MAEMKLNLDLGRREKADPEAAKKIVLLSALIFFGALIVMALGWWLYQGMQYTKYFSQKDGFQASYPKAWALKEHPSKGVIAVFVSPKASSLDLFQENVNISMTDMSKNPLTLEKYVEVTNNQMTKIFKNITVKESVHVNISGHPGHKFVFFAKADPAMSIVVYAFLYRDTAYNITYMGMTDQYLKDRFIIWYMMNSLKVFF